MPLSYQARGSVHVAEREKERSLHIYTQRRICMVFLISLNLTEMQISKLSVAQT
jgi:hypothetical protein